MKNQSLLLVLMLFTWSVSTELVCGNQRDNAGDDLTECGKIIASCMVAASLYGVAQTQIVLAHCSPLYSTDLVKDTLQGGIEKSWWRGALIGVPVALACRFGSWPKLSCGDVVKPMACTMGLTAATAAARGAWVHSQNEKILKEIDSDLVEAMCFYLVSGDTVKRTLNNSAAHIESLKASCLAGPIWSIGLIVYILKTRYNMSLDPQDVEVDQVN